MKIDPQDGLNEITKEEDALDQSIALNRIVMNMLAAKKREDFWLRIILLVSILVNVVIAGIFVAYESQWTTTTTTTTVTQDTGEGTGNNIFQTGENAEYNQGEDKEVIPGGETNGYNNYNHTNQDQ